METTSNPANPNLYAHYVTPEEVKEALADLKGILLGIEFDKEVNDLEVERLLHWAKSHYHLIERNPFWEIKQAIRVSTVDVENRSSLLRDVLWMCERYEPQSPFYSQVNTDLLVLKGICEGIMADGVVNAAELDALDRWMQTHQHLHRHYPYDEIRSLVGQIHQRKLLDEADLQRLGRFFSDFAQPTGPANGVRDTDDDLLALLDVAQPLALTGKRVCAAGFQSISKLNKLKTSVLQNKGLFDEEPSDQTNYLIVSESTNPNWRMDSGGRKIESAIRLRQGGYPIVLMREADFWQQLSHQS